MRRMRIPTRTCVGNGAVTFAGSVMQQASGPVHSAASAVRVQPVTMANARTTVKAHSIKVLGRPTGGEYVIRTKRS